jgi:3-phosphoshikimate 1-carboxyvinyltransferase
MLKYGITAPQKIDVGIALPASKSISNRALIMSALSYSSIPVQNLSESDDTQVLYKALNSNTNIFDIGPAGTAMRFLTAFLSKIVGEWVITGSERMKKRPIKILVDALHQLGARIEYVENEGYPPLRIFGSSLQGKTIELDGNVSSQYISALLMIGPTLIDGLTLSLRGTIISRPYIRMTLDMMSHFGITSQWEGNTIHIPMQEYKPNTFAVEPDWSAASYWYQIAALSPGATVYLKGLVSDSYQGDSRCWQLFEQLGVSTIFDKSGARLNNNSDFVTDFEVDFLDQPDLAQTFVVTCLLKGITFNFSGLQSLKIKETNRVAALIAEARKLGFVLHEPFEGALSWRGETCKPNTELVIETYEDHRMAMAFAPASLQFDGLQIADPAVVSKSYPRFWDDLSMAGFVISQ